MEEKSKPLFKKSFGASEHKWNNLHTGTNGPTLCQLCGKEHPQNDSESYTLIQVLGIQGVDQCCGKVVDILYDEWGEDFAIAFLKEFANNPLDPHFSFFFEMLKENLVKARQKVEELQKEIVAIEKTLASVK